MGTWRILPVLAVVLALLAPLALVGPQPSMARAQGTCFNETGFCITQPDFATYFARRGGAKVLGFPVSRDFVLEKFRVQFFQRVILQLQNGSVERLNVLDPDILPVQRAYSSTFPAPDPNLAAQAPRQGPNYSSEVVTFVRRVAPDTLNGVNVSFFSTFDTTVDPGTAFPDIAPNPGLVTLANLEIWGVPTSAPAVDPNNPSFIYQRFQRGIMHYRATCRCTEGVLVGDYLKAVILNKDLPSDLAADTASSRFRAQYDSSRPLWVARPNELHDSDLTSAFEPGTPGSTPTPTPTRPPVPTASRPVIAIQRSDLERLRGVLELNDLSVESVNVARTATFVMPSPGSTVTLVAPLTTPPTSTQAELLGPGADVAIGVLQAGRTMPLDEARVPSLPADIYLVKVVNGQMVFTGTNGRDLMTGLPADLRQMAIPRKAPQTIVSYKDVCFSWNTVQVCTQPSPTAALSSQEQAELTTTMTAARDGLRARGALQNGDANVRATVAEAVGQQAVNQRRANVLAAPSVGSFSLPAGAAPADGALLGIFQISQSVDLPNHPSVPPGAYAAQSMQSGSAVLLTASDGRRLTIPTRRGEVRGAPLSAQGLVLAPMLTQPSPAEENLAIIVDLWMILCFFDEQDICDG